MPKLLTDGRATRHEVRLTARQFLVLHDIWISKRVTGFGFVAFQPAWHPNGVKSLVSRGMIEQCVFTNVEHGELWAYHLTDKGSEAYKTSFIDTNRRPDLGPIGQVPPDGGWLK